MQCKPLEIKEFQDKLHCNHHNHTDILVYIHNTVHYVKILVLQAVHKDPRPDSAAVPTTVSLGGVWYPAGVVVGGRRVW